MRWNKRAALILCALIGACVLFTEAIAFAQCPPGTHWSNRAWQCVPNRWAPPPPPPPPPPPGPSCRKSYNRCVYACAGVPACINNCNVGYNVCRQQRGY